MRLYKINRFSAILILSLLLFIGKLSAETTFFDNPEDSFIMTNSISGGDTDIITSGGGICLTNWNCTSWSSCTNGIQTRNCTKEKNYCYADTKKKPAENQSCSVSQLFDIKFELESAEIEYSNELISIIIFYNFGNTSTTVNLTYSILDNNGKEVYNEKGSVTVTTNQIIRKNFENLNLPRGKYTIVLTTLYNDNVRDEFKQDFEIKSTSSSGITGNVILSGEPKYLRDSLILWGVAIVGVASIVFYIRRRKMKFKRGT
jgi:hypothetical protein